MSPRESVRRLVHGVLADLDDYARLRDLLEAQFEAALRHESAHIGDIGGEIAALAETMESRRAERVQLVAVLTDATGREAMPSVLARLPQAARALVEPAWQALEQAVRECKALNVRNCRLLMDQYEIMQRVLDAEADIYVPL